jgi:hypothetical protein
MLHGGEFEIYILRQLLPVLSPRNRRKSYWNYNQLSGPPPRPLFFFVISFRNQSKTKKGLALNKIGLILFQQRGGGDIDKFIVLGNISIIASGRIFSPDEEGGIAPGAASIR